MNVLVQRLSIGRKLMNGSGPGLLNGPHDAKVIADDTGITPSFGNFFLSH